MNVRKAQTSDIPELKALFSNSFEKSLRNLDFIFENCDAENIYVAEENGKPVSMRIVFSNLEYKGKKGYGLHYACTEKSNRGKGYMHSLVKHVLECKEAEGNDFCVLKPASNDQFSLFRDMGFEYIGKMRVFNVDIKKNLWRNADFDIVTASRFKGIRAKLANEEIIHYSSKDYEKYAMYMYSNGGSTAENEHAYCVYFIKNSIVNVIELLADDTNYANKLLQAIRERTACEKAVVSLSENSNLFLGEGVYTDAYMVHGLNDVYANLMFE